VKLLLKSLLRIPLLKWLLKTPQQMCRCGMHRHPHMRRSRLRHVCKWLPSTFPLSYLKGCGIKALVILASNAMSRSRRSLKPCLMTLRWTHCRLEHSLAREISLAVLSSSFSQLRSRPRLILAPVHHTCDLSMPLPQLHSNTQERNPVQ
jgi:hypothetical protein